MAASSNAARTNRYTPRQGRYFELYTRQHAVETNLFLAPGEGDKIESAAPDNAVGSGIRFHSCPRPSQALRNRNVLNLVGISIVVIPVPQAGRGISPLRDGKKRRPSGRNDRSCVANSVGGGNFREVGSSQDNPLKQKAMAPGYD